ncbi:MAG: chalcone isomerase family protein [Burkholderiaceae bacterium]
MGLCAAFAAHAAPLSGQRCDDRIRLADTELHLNGIDLRAGLWLEGYAAGLYLPVKTTRVAEAIAEPAPKRLRMRMMLDVPAKEFNKAVGKGVGRNSNPTEQEAVHERIDRFMAPITAASTVKKGDVIDLDILPERGLLLSINGRPQGDPIPGADVYAAVLKIFLGDRPVDRVLKSGLLGGPTR